MIETKFKKTELGPIPEDWKIYALGTVSDIKTGPFGSALHASDYVRFGTPIITVEHLGEPYIIHAPNIPLVGLEDKKRLSQYTLRTGDIVYSRVGSVDRNSVVTEKEDGWLFSGRLLRVRNSGTYYAPYLGYHLNSDNAKKRIVSSAVGLGMPSINTKILGDHIILLPNNIDEQKNIAEALSDVDDLIHELDVLIEKKRAIFQGSMQDLLSGHRRLPGFSEPWQQKKLNELVHMNSGGTPSTSIPEYYSGNIPFLSISDITISHKYLTKTQKHISELAIRATSARLYPKGTILLSMYASIGKVCISSMDVAISQAILGFTPIHSDFLLEYLYYVLCFSQKDLASCGQTGTQSNLNKRIVQNFTINMPTSITEQHAIASILSDMDAEITELEAKRDKYAAIRQGMMQQLLTGKIRLI